jgi:LPS export ABC transporter protein LptC
MRKITRYLLGFLFFILIAEMVLVLPSELKESKYKPLADLAKESATANEDVRQFMQGVHAIESKNENKEWELWATSAIVYKKQNDMELQKIKANFFAEDGVSFEVTGEKGSFLTEEKNMKVEGDVLSKSSNGYTFKTNSVQYNSIRQWLSSDSPVEVHGPRDQNGGTLKLTGNSMSANMKTGLVSIEYDVRAQKLVREGKRMLVTSEKVELSGKSREVRFTGNVIIDVDGTRISGPDALFKHNAETHQLESIDLDGGVKVSDLNKWATSEKLKIDIAKNEFVFDGRPRVVQDNDEVRGDRIVFKDGGKVVKVQNAKIKVSQDSIDSEKLRKGK